MTQDFDPGYAHQTLFSALLRAAHRHGGKKVILEDADGTSLTYDKLILACTVLGRQLARLSERGEFVGVLLPSSAGLAITLFGLNAFDRVAALLNFSAGRRQLCSAVQTGRIRTVLTSRRFIELGKLEDLVAALADTEYEPGKKVRLVYLEDVRASIGLVDKLRGALSATLTALIQPRRAEHANDPAVVLFTSGTEGVPKGVVLSNANLLGNVEQMQEHVPTILSPTQILLNPLPMFHSFGLTAATLAPVLSGVKTVLYPSPLHYKQVPKICERTKPTVMLATDTFLAGYIRAAEPGQLKSLRYVIAGAERVKENTRALWEQNGTELLEGYGVTETAPVLSVNKPGANRHGTVGPLLPGIEARLEPVEGLAEGQRLYVRGPNIMQGYILSDEPGRLVPPHEGWHDTGDIVTMDDGYVSICGRAKRFAKLGGEMVSLAAVETLAGDLWSDAHHVVLNLPDPRKGEVLILVTDKGDANKDALLAYARKEGFPELWVPKTILIVPEVPLLATGKINLQETIAVAREALAQK